MTHAKITFTNRSMEQSKRSKNITSAALATIYKRQLNAKYFNYIKMKIIFQTTPEHLNELKEIVKTMIINLEAWENGEDKKLKYKLGEAIIEDLSINITN